MEEKIKNELKHFIEKYPLYRKAAVGPFSYYASVSSLKWPTVNFYCPNCKLVQTYTMNNEEWYERQGDLEVYRVQYCCVGCEKDIRAFFIEIKKEIIETKGDNSFAIFYLKKIGQLPAWSIKIDKKLEKILEKKQVVDLYKKGLISESQGYGIGAFAYYRRVVEKTIDDLLNLIGELLEGEEKERYSQVLEKTKSSKRVEDKLKIVKELLPFFLKPGGTNPLSIIYSALSDGLHNKNDDVCLEKAELIRESLLYLVSQIIEKKEENKKFVGRIKKLLQKNS